MKECLFCKSSNLVKNGKPRGKQRWKCKGCKKNSLEGKKYSIDQKRRVITAYTRGVGIRAIGDIEKIPFQLVAYWIKIVGRKIKGEKVIMWKL
jgi:transposase-like protein